MKSIRFLAESVTSNGMVYKVGDTANLDDHAAYHWLKRGAATIAEPKKKEEKPEAPQKDEPDDEAKPAQKVAATEKS